MLSIWKRELQGYFFTPVGYVFMGVFMGLSGLIFYLYNLQYLSSDLLSFLSQSAKQRKKTISLFYIYLYLLQKIFFYCFQIPNTTSNG